MAEQIKFTDDEIQQINKLREDVSNVFHQLGQFAVEKKKLLDEANEKENEYQSKYTELVEFEQTLFKTLNEKYGDGNYDPLTGMFTPNDVDQNVS